MADSEIDYVDWMTKDILNKYENGQIEWKDIEDDEDLVKFLQWAGEMDNIL